MYADVEICPINKSMLSLFLRIIKFFLLQNYMKSC